jgi:hypothetical protein
MLNTKQKFIPCRVRSRGFHERWVQVRRCRGTGGRGRRSARVEERLWRAAGARACRGAGDVLLRRRGRRWCRLLTGSRLGHDPGGFAPPARAAAGRRDGERDEGDLGGREGEDEGAAVEKVLRRDSSAFLFPRDGNARSRSGSMCIKKVSNEARSYGNQLCYSNVLSLH